MTDENPYSPPKSYLGGFGSTRPAAIVVLAAVIVLAIVGAGLVEALRHPSKSLLFISIPAIPAILSLAYVRFPGFKPLRILAMLFGVLFSGILMLVCIGIFRRFGVSYPLALLYSGSLSLALGICALAIFRWKRTDLFASNTGRQLGSDVD